MASSAVKCSADRGHLISSTLSSSISPSGDAPKHGFSRSMKNPQAFITLFTFTANSFLAISSLSRPYFIAAVSTTGGNKVHLTTAAQDVVDLIRHTVPKL